jgi:hypothetical protein
MKFQCHFEQGCWTFLHVFIGHFFFWELFVHFICPFINWVIDSFRG